MLCMKEAEVNSAGAPVGSVVDVEVSSNCGGSRGSVEYWMAAFGGESGSRAIGRGIVVVPTGALSSTSAPQSHDRSSP